MAVFGLLVLCFWLAFAIMRTESIPISQSVIRGRDISLPCTAYEDIQPFINPTTVMVEWTKDGIISLVESARQAFNGRFRLAGSTNRYRLTISVTTPADQGVYTCRVEGDPTVPSTVTPLLIETTETALTVTAVDRLSEESNVTLSVEEPTPPGDPFARVTKMNSIDISWTGSNGPVTSYEVLYRTTSPGSVAMRAPNSLMLSTSLLVSDLEVYTDYRFWLVAQYIGDYTKTSGVAFLMTAPGTPTTAPPSISAVATRATMVQVNWTAPPLDTLNGDLVGYKIMLSSPEKSTLYLLSNGPGTSKEVARLLPYTDYIISVAVVNNAMGEVAVGPYSLEARVTTLEAAPGTPLDLKSVGQAMTSITIFWYPPERHNSDTVMYNVDFRKSGATKWLRVARAITLRYHTETDLEIYTEYEFIVSAENRIGEGLPTPVLRVFSDVAAPSPPVNVTVTDLGMGRAKVSWMKPEIFNKSVDSYTIIYWEFGKNVTINAVEVNKLSRIIDNLQTGVQYGVKVRAATTSLSSTTVQGNPSESVFFIVPKPVGNTTEEPSTTAPNGTMGEGGPVGSDTGMIVGVVFAMAYVLALLIVGVGFLVVRMRKKDQLEFEKQENGIPPAFAKPDELEEPPIPINKFEAHVIANHADSDGGFATEYEDIQHVSTTYPALSSNDPNLKYKNRYTNIVAYDHTRVKLSILPNQPLSDYINANYIDGYGRQKAFIAAQGPLKTTFDDFWRMLWEQHTMVIVMITKLEERGRRKCDRYWPAKGMPERYGEFEVTLESKEKYASHILRYFMLKHKHRKHGKAPERRIVQFHFTDWPDHGVPAYTLPVLSFVQKSSSANPEDAGPIVVHCSAGVGRTGTYIVIDSMLKQIQTEGKVNVFGFLKRIRTQRNYLVQTEEQYVFIHDVLVEWLKAGYTKVQAADLRKYADRMTLPDERGKVLLDEHFKFIATQKVRDYEFSKARQVLNRSKNRSKVIPIERNRVSISGVAGQESSDYINASFLQGFHRNKEFIVTQYPMKETMTEFWRMLWESNSTTIVMLTDEEKNDGPIYWPSNKDESLTFGTITVTLCEEEHSNMSYITREFTLCCSQDDDQLTVKQYHCSYWPDSCSPLHTTFDLVYALEERSQVLSVVNKDVVGPVTVHDRFGGRQAGTFCALYTLHQQMVHQSCVDVYQLVKLYVNKRPGMFSSKEEYYFLYQALQSAYTAEQQMKSITAVSLKRHNSENKDWHKMRFLTALPDSNLRPMTDSARNSSLDSDNWYRARSQTLASTGTQRSQRPTKFWHRRTKSEKRKPNQLGIANVNALEVTPPNASPDPEVYDLTETLNEINGSQVEGSVDSEAHAGNGTPSTVPDTTVIPDIHLNGLDHMHNDKHASTHIEDGETIALMESASPDTSRENVELSREHQFAGSKKVKSLSRESLGTHSVKSEETRM